MLETIHDRTVDNLGVVPPDISLDDEILLVRVTSINAPPKFHARANGKRVKGMAEEVVFHSSGRAS